MRIESGSMNFSRIPGQYAYQVRNYRTDPVENVDPLIGQTRSKDDVSRLIGASMAAERAEPDLYYPPSSNFHHRQNEVLKGRFLDLLV